MQSKKQLIPVNGHVDRREFLSGIGKAVGSAMLLSTPGIAVAYTPPASAASYTVGQIIDLFLKEVPELQEILASVADTIIPAGNSIGALSVGVDKFLQKLIDNCYEEEVQDNVKTQLMALEATAQSTYGRTFQECNQGQREEMLLRFSVSTNEAEESFFKLIKSETIRGFNTSREVMVNHHHYKQVPGHFYGCADVNA